MNRKLKQSMAAWMAGIMLLALMPQVGTAWAADEVMLCEDYTDAALLGADVAELGWTKSENTQWVNPDSTTLAIDESGLHIKKGWSNAAGSWQWAMKADKALEAVQTGYGGEPRMTVRRGHFKGVYDLSLTASCTGSGAGVYEFFSIAQQDGTKNEFYLEQYANGTLNIAGQSVTLASDMTGEQSYRLRFDFTESGNGFQLFRAGSDEPVSVDGVNRFPMSLSAAPLSPLPSYLTGLTYYFQARDADGAEILLKKLELTEVERTEDVTDLALAALPISALTAAPDAVTEPLQALPTTLFGAEITWTSGAPDIISNDGQSVNRPTDADCDVVMTAKLVNPIDGFTQQAEYKLTVLKASGDELTVAHAREALTLSMLTDEPANAITRNLFSPLPSTDESGQVAITWHSSNPAVMSDAGVVVRPDSFLAEEVTMTARLVLREAVAEKVFVFKVLGTKQKRVILDEDYTQISNDELSGLGWSVMQGPENGTFGVTDSGLRIVKTLEQGDGFQAAYRVQRDLTEVVQNYHGDRHLTLRRGQFKGAYDLELGLTFQNSRGAIMMFLSGGREDGQAHDFYFSQQGTGGANTLTFDNSYNYGAIASGLNRQHRYTFRLDYENDITVARKVTRGFSLFVDDSEEPQRDDGTQSTVFPMENAAITGAPPAYLDGLNFWLQMQNTTNASVTVDSLRLVELSRIEDVTDAALAQLTMEMLTDTPDDVSGALKPLPTTLCGAEISWSSNYPDIISHDGQKVVKPLLGDKVVTLTARVRNPQDLYTQYLDFALTVKAQNRPDFTDLEVSGETYDKVMDAESLQAAGWQTSTQGGTLTADENGLQIEKTTDAAFGVTKTMWQTVPNANGDSRMTVRRSHFKGIYDVELDMAVQIANGRTTVDVLGRDVQGTDKTLAALRQSAEGLAFAYPFGTTLTDTAGEQHRYKLRLDTLNDVTFVNGEPKGTTKAFSVFMDAADTPVMYSAGGTDCFPMTGSESILSPEPSYIRSLSFRFEAQNPKGSRFSIRSVKLREQYRQEDETDKALAMLKTSLLTDTPEAVTGPLNALPDRAEGADNVSIRWYSDHPEILSDDGQIFNEPAADTVVVMTAELTNLTDGYTQYADFALDVKGSREEVVADFRFADENGQKLLESGCVLAADGLSPVIDNNGRLTINAAAEGDGYTPVLRFVTRCYDETNPYIGEERIAHWTDKLKGEYRFDVTLKATGSGSLPVGFGVTGTKNGESDAMGANLLFDGETLQYMKDGSYQTLQADDYMGKWIKLRFVIDTEKASGGVQAYAAVGTGDRQPEDSELVCLTQPIGGIFFGSAEEKYDYASTPCLLVRGGATANVTIENVTVTKVLKKALTGVDALDTMLDNILMRNITDTPSSFLGCRKQLTEYVVYDYDYYPVSWTSSMSSLVTDAGRFIGTEADAGKTVYLTARVSYGGLDKNKSFRLTIGQHGTDPEEPDTPDDGQKLPTAKNVTISGTQKVGGVLQVHYTFYDPNDKADASEIKWQVESGGAFGQIIGAYGLSFTVTEACGGKSVRAAVYPKNADGATGEVIYSEAVKIAKSTSGGTTGGGGGTGASSGGMRGNDTKRVDLDDLPKPTDEPSTDTDNFLDVTAAHWAHEAVYGLAAAGVVNGVDETHFAPNENVTREQAAQMFAKAFVPHDDSSVSRFTDISPDDWAYTGIAALETRGILSGYEDGSFKKGNWITRQEFAVMLCRTAEVMEISLQGDEAGTFADDEQIADYAKEAVQKLAASGIVTGSEGQFKPQASCTRAEAAQMIYKLMQRR